MMLEQPIVVVQWLRHVRLSATLRTAACQASLSFTVSQSLLKLMSIRLPPPKGNLIFHKTLLPFVH